MLSIAPMTAGQSRYYTDLGREDYYTRGGEPPGRWTGDGAASLGLEGTVSPADLQAVFAGFHPGGRKLVQNAGRETRQAGLDLTFSAPKSVSIAWAAETSERRTAIDSCHRRAVDAAVLHAQQAAAWTRRGRGGGRLERADLVVAAFDHHTSRAQDVQLHTHALVLNIGVRADGTTGSLKTDDLFRVKMALGATYRAELAHGLRQELGYKIVPRTKGLFEIAGVPETLRDSQSTRHMEIRDALGHDTALDPAGAAMAALHTRSTKGHIDREALLKKWNAEFGREGWDRTHLVGEKTRDRTERERARLADRAVSRALGEDRAWRNDRLTQPVFRAHDITRFAAQAATDGRVSAADVLQAVERRLQHLPGLDRLGRIGAFDIYATRDTISQERSLIAHADEMHNGYHRGLTAKAKRAMLRSARDANLGSEATGALEHITGDGSGLRILNGRAGTGKTTILRTASSAWRKSGYRVIGAAVSGRAARGLETSAGIDSATIEMRRRQMTPTWQGRVKHSLNQLRREAFGKRTYRYEPLKFDRRTVLVVDEAGMASTSDLAFLVGKARRAGARVVLTGDDRQLPAIDGGSPFGFLTKRYGSAELTINRRQKPMWLREAVFHFASGNTRAALTVLQKQRRTHVERDSAAAVQRMALEWSRDVATPVQEKLMMAGTREQVDQLNIAAQLKRRAKDELRGHPLRHGTTQFFENDRVCFRKNDYRLDVRNGDFGTIERATSGLLGRGQLRVRLDTGRRVSLNLATYGHIELGYAVTAHRAQGATVTKAFALTGPETASAELAYVQLSRATLDTHLVTTAVQRPWQSPLQQGNSHDQSLSALAQAMRRSSRKTLATETQLQLDQHTPDLER